MNEAGFAIEDTEKIIDIDRLINAISSVIKEWLAKRESEISDNFHIIIAEKSSIQIEKEIITYFTGKIMSLSSFEEVNIEFDEETFVKISKYFYGISIPSGSDKQAIIRRFKKVKSSYYVYIKQIVISCAKTLSSACSVELFRQQKEYEDRIKEPNSKLSSVQQDTRDRIGDNNEMLREAFGDDDIDDIVDGLFEGVFK